MALFEVEVSSPNEDFNKHIYMDLANQFLMISTIMIIMHLISLSSSKSDLMKETFITVYLYVLIGVAYYHLLVKRLIIFV